MNQKFPNSPKQNKGLLNKGGTILLVNVFFFFFFFLFYFSEDRSNETTPLGCCVRECLDFIKEDPRVHRVNEKLVNAIYRDFFSCKN